MSEDLISQFMVFTGCLDGERAQHYLEMSNMNVETAVGLYMEHAQQGSASSGAALASPEIRAPDRTRTMRLMDDVGMPSTGLRGYVHAMDDHDIVMSAFAHIDARAVVNAAAAADDDSDAEEKDPDQPATRSDELSANLSDMFAPPTHLMHRGGGFQGARAVARDARRWLLVNIQRDSEFACHALNRDVWRDELVENLVREGFIFWQAVSHFKLLQTCLTKDQFILLNKTSRAKESRLLRGTDLCGTLQGVRLSSPRYC
jgi:UBX domain-containing protein 7